jgi:DNA-binding LacI/PurR family transcriptional regulator
VAGSRFWSAILRVAEDWSEADGVGFQPYFLAERFLDIPEHRRLCADLADGGLAGVLSVTNPHYLAESPVLAYDHPRVCIGDGSDEVVRRFRASWVGMDDAGVYETVLRRLRAEGRRRIAFITHPWDDACPWLSFLAQIGLATRPEWWLQIPPSAAVCAHPMTRLLCSWPGPQRPDALMITDDNLVPFATAGVLDAGLRVPQDLVVAAHTNFPMPTHASVPCLRYGVDVVALLRCAIAELLRLMAGAPPRSIAVPRVVEVAG